MQRVFLDYASATPVDKRVLEAMLPFYESEFYNPSAIYKEARDVRDILEQARADTARILGARPSEIVFTAGATESINLAIHGVMRRFPSAEMIVSSIEHDAVLKPAQDYRAKIASVDKRGRVLVDELIALVSDNTVLVSVMIANNEVGTIQPIKEIADRLQQIRVNRKKRGVKTPLYLHSDGAQAPNCLSVQLNSLGVDLLSLNGGKIYGPKQSGILFVRAGIQLEPLIKGGEQEWGMRSGTENVAHAVGFAKALEIAQADRQQETKRLKTITQLLRDKLQEKIPDVQLIGHKDNGLANTTSVLLPGCDSEWLVMALDEQGVLVSAGSACGASKEGPSHVLKAMGLTDDEANAVIRITAGRQTTEEQIAHAVAVLVDVYSRYLSQKS